MAQHGWGGKPPSSEPEARQRIIDAAAACIDRHGVAKTTLSDVAAELAVTRQTVYRYFPRLSDVVEQVGAQGAAAFVDRLVAHVDGLSTAPEAVVEGIIFCVREVPTEPRLSLLLQIGEDRAFISGATSQETVEYGAAMLRRFPVDWADAGVDDSDLAGLAELILRLIASLLQNPSLLSDNDDELRGWLRRWVAPAMRGA